MNIKKGLAALLAGVLVYLMAASLGSEAVPTTWLMVFGLLIAVGGFTWGAAASIVRAVRR